MFIDRLMKAPALVLCLGSALLLTLSWPVNGISSLIFIAFVPLLILERRYFQNGEKQRLQLFGWSYLCFLLWNIGATWWVWNASEVGAILAFVFNTLFMAIVFTCFHVTHVKLGDKLGYLALPAFWMAFEYLHLNWELTWPWLTLGNVFANTHQWVQWYEYTGVFGGAVWIFAMNLLVLHLLKKKQEGLSVRKTVITLLLVLNLPVTLSYAMYYSYKEEQRPVNVVLVQPNIDPYNEKFGGMSSLQQLERIIGLANSKADSSTDLLVAPETALPEGIWEDQLSASTDYKMLLASLKAQDKAEWIIGLSSNRFYPKGSQLSPSARKFTDSEDFYDSYNTAMHLKADGDYVLYHKSKLVPGVERMPYPGMLKFLEVFSIDLGGASGSLGTQEERAVFKTKTCGVAPVICYESVFGEYVGAHVKNGAELIALITNDGWWGDTPGYHQHADYARLRAIEHRRSIARSANTGISCFIDQRGDMLQASAWWQPAAVKGTVNANAEFTFYTRFGDYLAWIAIILSTVLAGMGIFAAKKLKTLYE